MCTYSTILLVESFPENLALFQDAFRKAQLKISLKTLTDSQSAIDYLSGIGEYSNRELHPLPSLIIFQLDIVKVSGFQLLDWWQRQSNLQKLPVVVFTQSIKQEDYQRAYELGANSCLINPTNSEELAGLLKNIYDLWIK
ncbi:response regulator [Tolypothrix campylonemoides VB511288_2]|uniref:Response regulatory domain-containing protein n=3 Tax=Nostocales TaxID=1161 RepID=A0A0C1N4N6_9CYAN